MRQLLVFAKAPVPGQVKTRLVPAVSGERAAQIHHDLLRHTLETCATLAATEISLWCAPDIHHPAFAELAVQHDIRLETQTGANLGERMAAALNSAVEHGNKAVLVGSDIPGLTAALLESAFAVLHTADAVLGPAADGGYYLVGLRRPSDKQVIAALFDGIAWSTATVLDETRRRLAAMKRTWAELDTLRDLDTPDDLAFHRLNYGSLD